MDYTQNLDIRKADVNTDMAQIVNQYMNLDVLQLQSDRHIRGKAGMEQWARIAKRCYEMVEDGQWTPEMLSDMAQKGRAAFAWNEIKSLILMIIGYQSTVKTDIKIFPEWQGSATQDVAEMLTKIIKQLAEACGEQHVDVEVLLDGIIGGRGFYDARLSFLKNELGELDVTSGDPFSTILDPDADRYDLNYCNWIQEERWVDLEEVRNTYGEQAVGMIDPLNQGNYGMPVGISQLMEVAAPWRTFGGDKNNGNALMHQYWQNCYDPARKNIRLIDCQHYVPQKRLHLLDLETGRKEPIPDFWTKDQVQRIISFSQDKYAKVGKVCPIKLVTRPCRRVRWTTTVGDIIVFDAWSPYESFTKVMYSPYFRRGKTQGIVEPLIDPQNALNKAGSANLDVAARAANAGWQVHEDALSPEERDKLETEGGSPGYTQYWRGAQKPDRLEPGQPSVALLQIVNTQSDALKRISNINENALGQPSQEKSGVAIKAKTQQTVIGIQPYLQNLTRTKELLGLKKLEIIQNNYTEQRIYMITGDDGKDEQITINKKNAAGEIVNDLTNGNYRYTIKETPLNASYESARQDEMLEYIKAGILNIEVPGVREAIIDASSIPNKEVIKKAYADAAAAQGQAGQAQAKAEVEAMIQEKVIGSLAYKDAPPSVKRQIEAKAGMQPASPVEEFRVQAAEQSLQQEHNAEAQLRQATVNPKEQSGKNSQSAAVEKTESGKL